ncbi:histidine phosphatase family protein [Candidatus Woesearchaeota archaeon]|nr:histidine phosphatase family protein [Candidatus Woesearchaeota archaeon]
MKLIIVRHGETFENAAGISQGQTHGRLNENGVAQAKKVAQRLKGEKIDVAYSSDLQRAADTAKEILKFHPSVETHFVKELREFSKGKNFDGQPSHVYKKHYKEQYKKSQISFHAYKWPGGESFVEAQKRIANFYKELIKRHLGKTVLIVSHGGLIASLLLHLKKLGFEKYYEVEPKNTGVTVIEVDDKKGHKISLLNCTKHLQ